MASTKQHSTGRPRPCSSAAEIVDDREGVFEPMRRCHPHFVEAADDSVGQPGMVSRERLEVLDKSTSSGELVAIGQDAEHCDVRIDGHEVVGYFERGRGRERPLAVFCGRAEMTLTEGNPRADATRRTVVVIPTPGSGPHSVLSAVSGSSTKR